jgi:(1->4)-alpha-D-glucan 1-alpha-D-glucosylmutase
MYMEKAVREAKGLTAWTRVNEEYEGAMRSFIEAVFEDEGFLADLEAFVAPLVGPGRINSLAQTLIKLTAPGVPDFYQGSELWDLSLVDPDNRRPVDYELRRRLLTDLERDGITPEDVLARMDEGLPKLWVIRQALAVRRRLPDLFEDGVYRSLRAKGPKADHALAFLREKQVAAVVPRLVIGLGGDWQETTLELPDGSWTNELTGEQIEGGRQPLADLLARFPVALLVRR